MRGSIQTYIMSEASFTTSADCSSLAGGTWIAVNGDPTYQASDFCVMKYEAKNVSSAPESNIAATPWVNITQTNSISACTSLGADYELITNEQWMTIATNIAAQGNNWNGGTVGTNALNRGNSDGSVQAAAADSVARPISYVPPSPAQQITGLSMSFMASTAEIPVATAGELAKVVAAVGTP